MSMYQVLKSGGRKSNATLLTMTKFKVFGFNLKSIIMGKKSDSDESKETVSEFDKKRGNFKVSEFCITGDEPVKEIFDAIVSFHINPLNIVRNLFGFPINISDHSGYRPEAYELKKKRSGNSQHTFKIIYLKGRGAVDLTPGGKGSISDLLDLLISDSPYTRICHYVDKGFIHCDYKDIDDKGTRMLYEATKANGNRWTRIKVIS